MCQGAVRASRGDWHANERTQIELRIIEKFVLGRVQQHPRCRERRADRIQTSNVICMCMRKQHMTRDQTLATDKVDHFIGILAWINNPALASRRAAIWGRNPHHVAVGLKGAQWELLYHWLRHAGRVRRYRARVALGRTRKSPHHVVRAATARTSRSTALCAVALLACFVLLPACDQMSSDMGDASNSMFPPSPAEAGRWAVDDSDPENQRRGVLLIGNSGFGGEPVYVNLYRLYIDENSDPVVKATAIQALARHARAEDAAIIAKQLESKNEQIRIAAAKGLQRIHNPKITDVIWKKLIQEEETAAVRVELAIALGQYSTRDSFEALCSSLDDRELAVNLASADSLRLITGADFGLEPGLWRSWADANPKALREDVPYYYPTFERKLGTLDYLMFWAIPTFEQPGVPAGMRETAPADGAPQNEFGNLGEKG